mgnify:CR=1 FL=1
MLAQQERQLARLRTAMPGALPAARPRLERLGVAIEDQVAGLRALLERVGLPVLPLPKVAPRFNPLMGYMQLLRDWAWPDDVQNRVAAEAMIEAAGSWSQWRNVLVLGAGAGGLACDLHAQTLATETVALDINPLPLLVCDQLCQGNPVELWEFPAHPSRGDGWAIKHALRNPSRPEGLTPWLADALALPFVSGSFDAVVTHWFQDRVGRDPTTVASIVHRLLRPGGVWLNRGPLLYEASRDWVGRPDIDEALAWVRALGFEPSDHHSERVDYLCSPWSTQRRREVVHTFAARRPASVAWLDDDDAGVPAAVRSGTDASDPITAWCAAQLDGVHSVAMLARRIRERATLPFAAAREGVRERLHRAWALARVS